MLHAHRQVRILHGMRRANILLWSNCPRIERVRLVRVPKPHIMPASPRVQDEPHESPFFHRVCSCVRDLVADANLIRFNKDVHTRQILLTSCLHSVEERLPCRLHGARDGPVPSFRS